MAKHFTMITLDHSPWKLISMMPYYNNSPPAVLAISSFIQLFAFRLHLAASRPSNGRKSKISNYQDIARKLKEDYKIFLIGGWNGCNRVIRRSVIFYTLYKIIKKKCYLLFFLCTNLLGTWTGQYFSLSKKVKLRPKI